MTPLLPQAGGPRIAPFARLRTKPRLPCTREGRSASLSYQPSLADAAFCNLLAPAHSCRRVPPVAPLTSPSTKIRAAPPFGYYRHFYLSLPPFVSNLFFLLLLFLLVVGNVLDGDPPLRK